MIGVSLRAVRHNSSNVGGVTAGNVGHNYSITNTRNERICFQTEAEVLQIIQLPPSQSDPSSESIIIPKN